MSCSRRGSLRYVCGQTIDRTAMICPFLESPADLDVHLEKRFALFCWNRRNWRSQSWHPKQRNLHDVARTDVFRVLLMTIFSFFFYFSYVRHYAFLLVSVFKKSGKIDVKKCKISRIFVLMSTPWRAPLRHVYGYTNHRTAMIHTLLISPNDLDVHPVIRFSIFENISPKLASKCTLYGYVRR